MKKRMLAWIMTMCMVLSLLPVSALAVDEDEQTGGEDTNQKEVELILESEDQKSATLIGTTYDEEDKTETHTWEVEVESGGSKIVSVEQDKDQPWVATVTALAGRRRLCGTQLGKRGHG